MTTLLLTGYDEAFRPLGDLTSPLMQSYASRNGFDFHCARQFPASVPPSWHKIELVLFGLRQFERVIWLDADQKITNPDYVPDMREGFHASQDWGPDAIGPEQFSMGAFVVCRDAAKLFDLMADKREGRMGEWCWEQSSMRELFAANRDCMHIHSRRTFNAVPKAVHKAVIEPWEPGDWCAHMTHLTIEKRVKLFRKL